MLKVSPAAHALFQVLSGLELHVPARGECSRAQNVRGAYRKRLHSFFPHSHTLGFFAASCAPFLLAASPPLQKVPSETCGGNVCRGEGGRERKNKNGKRMGCSCSCALHLVSLIILRSILNKTTIKIL